MDDLSALRLQIEWGADEALLDAPVDRLARPERLPVSRPLGPRPLAPNPAAVLAPVRAAVPAPAATDAVDLPGLQAALDRFDACLLRGTASTTVAPSGNAAAGLVLIGEAPGAEDDRAGTAFAGQAGQALDRVLGSAGLGRDALLLCFLVPWRPPGGRPVNEAEVAQCLPFLLRLLGLVRPRRLVLLGGGPLRALTGDATSIRRARGRWVEAAVPGLADRVPALPMLPPDQWLSSPASKQAVWADLLTLRSTLDADRDGAG